MEERERFLAAVSHDLRTPLTRMKLYLEGKDLAEYKPRIQQEINEMAAMLDQTLDYLRGQAQPEAFQRLDVRALLEAMAEDAEALGQAVTFEGEAAPVMAQSRSLTRCVNNLVQNALRYGKTAQISLKEEGEQIVIEIADDGPGIPQEMLQRVFEPFVRLEESRSKVTGGVGLGLSIARGIARQHGGELSLYNATQGGLVARLTLPKNH
jgi:protein-histidine pros-kinase